MRSQEIRDHQLLQDGKIKGQEINLLTDTSSVASIMVIYSYFANRLRMSIS